MPPQSRRPKLSSARKLFLGLTTLFVTGLLSLLLAEVSLRLAKPQFLSPVVVNADCTVLHPSGATFDLARNDWHQKLTFNQLGFHDVEHGVSGDRDRGPFRRAVEDHGSEDRGGSGDCKRDAGVQDFV